MRCWGAPVGRRYGSAEGVARPLTADASPSFRVYRGMGGSAPARGPRNEGTTGSGAYSLWGHEAKPALVTGVVTGVPRQRAPRCPQAVRKGQGFALLPCQH